ncbi:MAG: DUF86 domain-containing protein [Lachnospiraceae bacterium]|nr:DUF86 domain-containing protein [Lachnospiraceae bacterium]
MDNKDRFTLEKIYHCIDNVLSYCADSHNLKEFESNPMRVEATVFNFLQIGEMANNKLSDESKEAMSEIPWAAVYGMRNRIVHGYEGVNMAIVWDTIQNDFPRLKKAIEKYLS